MISLAGKQINKNTPVPLYYQLKEILREHIRDGAVGDLIPTESDLCTQFDVSRPTVRQAISELVNEGYLQRSKGKGTFIAEPKIRRDFLLALQSFGTEMKERGFEPRTRVVTIERAGGDDVVLGKLGLSGDSGLVFLRRVQYAAEKPLMVVNSFLPHARLAGIEYCDFEANSLHDTLEHSYGLQLERAIRSIEAIACPEEEAELLEIEAGGPVQYLETTVFTSDGVPIEFSTAWYRGDRSRFMVELRRHEFPGAV